MVESSVRDVNAVWWKPTVFIVLAAVLVVVGGGSAAARRIDDEQTEWRPTVRESASGEDIRTRSWSCPSNVQTIDPMITSAVEVFALVLEDRISSLYR